MLQISRIGVVPTLLFLVTICYSTVAAAQAPEPTPQQRAAMGMLMSMAEQLGSSAKFQVDLRVSYDAVQADGQKIEFGEQRRISLERPTLLLVDERASDGAGSMTLFDGEWITVSNAREKVYARAPQPGDIDQSVQYFVRDLGMRMPLAAMLTTRFPQELEKRVLEISHVEQTDFLGVPADHLAGRMKDVDFQVWISAGQRPVPLRIVITYRKEPGQPQFRADFTDWKFNPSFLHKTFRFDPAPGAREVPLVAQFILESQGGEATAAPAATGDAPTAKGEQP